MSVTVVVPGTLSEHTGGAGEVVLEGPLATVADVLEALCRAHPALRDRLLTETGRLREHVNLFVGPESIRYTGGFDTPVAAGAEVTILPAVSGG